MIRCEPDKVRFCDLSAETGAALVHTVDLSDVRSVRPFVTFWTKGRQPSWAARHGLDDRHQREVYHRDEPWLPRQYPGKEGQGWSAHYHLDLTATPTLADLEPYLSELPAAIQEGLRAYLGGDVLEI